MPSQLRQLAAMSHIDFAGEDPPRMAHRLSWIGDWWFTSVSGQGNVRCRMDSQGTLPRDYLLLTLALKGPSPVSVRSARVGRPAGITLAPLDSFYELVASRPFHAIIVHVPRADLNRAAGPLPLHGGLSLSTEEGAGAVLGAALCALTRASERACSRDHSLRALLPGFAQLLRSLLVSAEPQGGGSARGPRLERVMEYLHAHATDPMLWSDQVAAACGLSRRQLYREFESGPSFAATLRRLRVEQAAVELTGRQPVAIGEVAFRCGFASADTLAAHFRAHFGCSPREYRRRVESERLERAGVA